MMPALTINALEKCKGGDLSEHIFVRVSDLQKVNEKKWSCKYTDASGACMDGIFASQIARALADGSLVLRNGDVIELQDYACNQVGESHKLIVTAMSMVSNEGTEAETAAKGMAVDQETAVKKEPAASPMKVDQEAAKVKGETKENVPVSNTASIASPGGDNHKPSPSPLPLSPLTAPRPGATSSSTPGLPPPVPHNTPMSVPPAKRQAMAGLQGTPAAAGTPSAAAGMSTPSMMMTPGSLLKTPGSTPKPPMPSPPIRESRPVQPIAALNPYDSAWTIKAKVFHKEPLRSYNRGGQQSSVFSVDLVDAEGGQIRGTFWRDMADKYSQVLEEGKVYYFSKFSVKPANKSFSTVKNDYQINFENRSEVEEAADQSGIEVTGPQVELVSFDKLPNHINRKVPVDVAGVVVSLGAFGTVKRKADNSELARRDVTLADQSRHSVVLTLWQQNATAAVLDGCDGHVLQVSAVRVGDFNGCSLSSGSRSVLTLDPETPECQSLKEWYELEGRNATFTPLGQAVGGAAAGGSGSRQDKLKFLSDVVIKENMPAPEDKPVYSNCLLSVARIDPEQTMYYLANPETGKKVVEQDGRYWSESEGKMIDAAHHRYVLQLQVMDSTSQAYISMFNEQAEHLLGTSAEQIAQMRQAGRDDDVKALVKNAQFTEWVMTVTAKSREWEGKRNMRYACHKLRPVDFVADSRRLLQMIDQMA